MKQSTKFLVLTGIAFQMGVTMYLGAYFGNKIDERYQFTTNYFTILFSLIAFVISIYVLIRQLKKINEKED